MLPRKIPKMKNYQREHEARILCVGLLRYAFHCEKLCFFLVSLHFTTFTHTQTQAHLFLFGFEFGVCGALRWKKRFLYICSVRNNRKRLQVRIHLFQFVSHVPAKLLPSNCSIARERETERFYWNWNRASCNKRTTYTIAHISYLYLWFISRKSKKAPSVSSSSKTLFSLSACSNTHTHSNSFGDECCRILNVCLIAASSAGCTILHALFTLTFFLILRYATEKPYASRFSSVAHNKCN